MGGYGHGNYVENDDRGEVYLFDAKKTYFQKVVSSGNLKFYAIEFGNKCFTLCNNYVAAVV